MQVTYKLLLEPVSREIRKYKDPTGVYEDEYLRGQFILLEMRVQKKAKILNPPTEMNIQIQHFRYWPLEAKDNVCNTTLLPV